MANQWRNKKGSTNKRWKNKKDWSNSASTKKEYKRSACKLRNDKRGIPTMTGWSNYKDEGFMSFWATPAPARKTASGKATSSKTKNPNIERWIVRIDVKGQLKPTWTNGFYFKDTGKLSMGEVGKIANPDAPYGVTKSGTKVKGYWGTKSKF